MYYLYILDCLGHPFADISAADIHTISIILLAWLSCSYFRFGELTSWPREADVSIIPAEHMHGSFLESSNKTSIYTMTMEHRLSMCRLPLRLRPVEQCDGKVF